MNRLRPIFLVLLLISAGTFAFVTVGSAVTVAPISIGNVTFSPTSPAPGDQVTITATFHNSAAASSVMGITQVSVRGSGVFASADDVSNLGPGDSVDVPFSVAFDSPGEKKLTVYMSAHDADGNNFVISKPVFVDVQEPHGALLSIDTTDAGAGGQTPVNVTVANGGGDTITGVRLHLGGAGRAENPERVLSSLTAGSERTFRFDVTFDRVGNQTLTARATYQTADGATQTATKSVPIDVQPTSVDAELTTAGSSDGSGAIDATLSNFGNVIFSDVRVTARANGTVVARSLMDDVDPKERQTVTLDVKNTTSERLAITATYTAAGQQRSTSVQTQRVLGQIRLTGVDATRTGTRLSLQGDAANVGSTDVQSVLVSVVDGPGVRPLPPAGGYFVGGVDASEFATFQLAAQVGPNTTEVPVQITYLVGGDRVTTVQRLHVEPASASTPTNGRSGGSGGPSLLLIAVVVVIAGAGYGLYRWRRR